MKTTAATGGNVASFATTALPLVSVDSAPLWARLQLGVSWNLASAVFTSACNFGLTVAVARIVGREQFGQFGMIQNTAVTLAGVAQLATGYTATKYVAEFRGSDKARTGRIIGVCSAVAGFTALIAALVLCLGAPWLAARTLRAPELTTALMLSSAFVCFATMNGYQGGALAGLESYAAMAKALMVASAANLVLAIGGAVLWGVPGVLAGLGLGAAVQWLVFRRVLAAETAAHAIRISYRGGWTERTIILRFALPASLSGVVATMAAWGANAVVARQPGGFDQLGLYNAANSMRSLILFGPLLLNRVSMSLLNHERGRSHYDRYRSLFLANLAMTTAMILAGVVVVGLGGPWLMRMFGKSFAAASPLLFVILVAAALEGILQAPYQIVQSHERMWQALWLIAVPRDSCLLLLTVFLAPRYGAMGLAIAGAVASGVSLLSISGLAWQIGVEPIKRATLSGPTDD